MKLSTKFKTTWPDDLLREFARGVLKVERFSAGFLAALRHVLGNQAEADRTGVVLDQCIRVDFTSPQTMRTINAKMLAAGIIKQQRRFLGGGKMAAVFVYRGERPEDPGRVREQREAGCPAVNEDAIAAERWLLEMDFAAELTRPHASGAPALSTQI